VPETSDIFNVADKSIPAQYEPMNSLYSRDQKCELSLITSFKIKRTFDLIAFSFLFGYLF
jgi:hypothetical protein